MPARNFQRTRAAVVGLRTLPVIETSITIIFGLTTYVNAPTPRHAQEKAGEFGHFARTSPTPGWLRNVLPAFSLHEECGRVMVLSKLPGIVPWP